MRYKLLGEEYMDFNRQYLVAAAFGLTGLQADAAPVITGISFILDKPGYNSTYSLGVEAYVQPGVESVVDVTATHTSTTSGSTGTWVLGELGTYWWAWAPVRVQQSDGPLDGTIEVVARDSSGATTSLSLTFQPDQEMEVPTVAVSWTGSGFAVTGNAVLNADYYDLWLWDPIDRYYPSSQRVTDPTELVEISGATLVEGRRYNLYWNANNPVETGPDGWSSLYRSMSLEYVTVPARSVPEPNSAAAVVLALLGLLAVRTLGREKQG